MTLRCIDLETTGPDPKKDHIIEVASIDLTREGGVTNPMEAFVRLPPNATISPEASAVHHLVEGDLATARPLPDVLSDFMGGTHYIAHNCIFEQSFLPTAFAEKWICTYKCALRVWPDAPAHNLQTLRYWRKHVAPFGRQRAEINAHRALSDVIVTAAIFHDLVASGAKFSDLLRWTGEPALHKWCRFGKYKGKTFEEVARIDASYLDWIVTKSDMDVGIKHSAAMALEQRRAA